MPKNKGESFWKKYGYIAGWISLISLVGLISSFPYILFLLTKTPSVFSTYEGCLVNKNVLQTFLTNKCNKMIVGESFNFTNADFPSNVLITETENLVVKINRATVDTCTALASCSYAILINDVITSKFCAQICITRASTNKTECFLSSECKP